MGGLFGGADMPTAQQRVIHEAPAAKSTASTVDTSNEEVKTTKNSGRNLLSVNSTDTSSTGTSSSTSDAGVN